MVWLQSNDNFDSIGELDTVTGKLTVRSRAELDPLPETAGFFAMLQGTVVALYREGTELFVRIDDHAFPLAEDVVAEVSGGRWRPRKLVVRQAGKVVASHKYRLDRSEQFADDPTPFVEDEDFDFGLFVANVSQSEERKAVLLGLA